MSKANILIVDDDPLVADSLAVFLRRRHYEVVVETDSHRALKVLRDKTPIDLLLSDVNMPGLSGEDVYHALRRRRPDIPVIFSTPPVWAID